MTASFSQSNGRSSSSISDNASGTSTTSNTTSTNTPVALPSEEALELLLSPDGYYTYLGIPKPDPSSIVSPSAKYASSLGKGGEKPNKQSNEMNGKEEGGIDLDLVKKNYRRLSLRHHPDRKTGDPETFRVLHRAKVVLSSPKLRREYDLVGLDLEDDAEDHDHHDDSSPTDSSEHDGSPNDSTDSTHADDSSGKEGKSTTDSVMSHLASATLAGVLQMVVRTGLMGLVAVVITRYTILTFLSMGLLFFLSFRIYQSTVKALGPKFKMNSEVLKDAASPLLIAFGEYCMYRGRSFGVASGSTDAGVDGNNGVRITGDSTLDAEGALTGGDDGSYSWSWTFWFGEALVMTLFLSNSFDKKSPPILALFFVISLLLSLLLRGKFWRYLTLLGFQGVIMLLVVLAFPIMEMILEEIVQEKMRKVGEKIRAHDAKMKECLKRKAGKGGRSS